MPRFSRRMTAGLRMPRFVREHAGIDHDLAQRADVFFLDVAAEDQVGIGVRVQRAVVLDLGFQLSRSPAGIAEREDGVLRLGALRDRLQNIHRRGQANSVVDLQRRILDEEIARMQHEAAAGLDRAAFQHLHGLGVLRQLDLIGLLDDVELHQQFGKVDTAGPAVDDDAHGAFGVMRAELDHLALEARHLDSSTWQRVGISAVRLLAGSRSGAVLMGGVAFHLQPGWKTYWLTPGDSGVPPRFDFSKSENIEAVTVLWPAPTKFDDGAGGYSLGYHDQVVLPLRIVAKNADKPVTLRADINYAVCEKLCIPVEASAELAIASVASTEDSALFAALDTVPKPANVGDPNPLTIRDVKREGKSTVLVDVAVPDTRAVDLFVEGPTPDWALPVPKLLERSPPGVKRFAFELEGLPPGTNPEGAALKLTLVGGDRAYEFNINLD